MPRATAADIPRLSGLLVFGIMLGKEGGDMSIKLTVVLFAALAFALDANAIIGRRGTTGSDMIATVNCHSSGS